MNGEVVLDRRALVRLRQHAYEQGYDKGREVGYREGYEEGRSDERELGTPATPAGNAERFLRRELADGPRLARELTAEAEGFSERTLRAVKKKIGVRSYWVGRDSGRDSYWELVKAAKDAGLSLDGTGTRRIA